MVVVDETQARNPAPDTPRPDAAADHSGDIYTAANVITVLRLILVPIFFAVLMTGQNDVVSFVLFALAASTDWLDGQIARRTGTVTVIGKAIDPLVDRLLIAAGVLGLYLIGRLPLWIVVVLITRDVLLLYGLWRLDKAGRQLSVTYIGKATTAVLLAGFSLLILNWPKVPGLGVVNSPALPGWGTLPVALGMWFVYIGVVLSIISALRYASMFARVRREGESAS
jgi:cardiolipin synthase